MAGNAVFYPNFLYTEIRNITGQQIHSDLAKMGSKSKNGLAAIGAILPGSIVGIASSASPSMVFSNTERTLKGCAQTIKNKGINNSPANLYDWEYLINETYAINGGNVLTRYKKFGYFMESDAKIERGCIYDSGPGYDEQSASGAGNKLSDTLLRCVSTDICLDLNLGIRRTNIQHWTNPVTITPHSSYLHLVQSNSIDPFFNLQNRLNLPVNTGVLHVDKYPYPSWNPPVIGRPQDIYLPYYDGIEMKDDIVCSKAEFHIRIWDSDYKFSFLKI